MKKLVTVVLAILLAAAPLAWAGAAETPAPAEATQEAEATTATPAVETESPAPEDGMDGEDPMGDLTMTPLSIDDKNIYDGMARAYQDGYTPAVSGSRVTIVLPLLADANLGPLTVTPNLGDAATAPFVFQNYQKTVSMSQREINGTKETRQVYYIRFDFSLSKNRYNGTYPVIIDVKGSGVEQSFTSYVTITDGKDPNEVVEPEVPAETKPQSQPIILVSGSTVSPEVPEAGSEFTLTVQLTNTDERKAVQNMTVTVTSDNPSLYLVEESNTFYYRNFAAGHTEELALRFKSDLAAVEGKYNVTLAMTYDNQDALTLNSTGTVPVSIVQPIRIELTPPTVEDTVNAGDTLPMSFQVMNLGRGSVYNVRCDVEVPGLIPSGSAFIGNMEAGTSATADINVFVGTLDMSEDYEGGERYGYTAGKIVLRYEDKDGQEFTQEFDVGTNINEPIIQTSGEQQEEETKTPSQWWIFVAAGAAVLIAILTIYLVRRRKKRNNEA